MDKRLSIATPKEKNRCWRYLADSCAELCQGRVDGYMSWEGIPVHDYEKSVYMYRVSLGILF